MDSLGGQFHWFTGKQIHLTGGKFAKCAEPPERLAILLGAEGPGLTPGALGRATHRVAIPISPDVDSLNVGHAAAIAFAVTGRPRAIDGT